MAMTGFYLSFLHKKKLDILKNLSLFFEELGELCKTGLFDFPHCLKMLCEKPKYKELTFIKNVISQYKSGENLKNIWENALKSWCPFYINPEVRGYLLSFSEAFGKSTREGFSGRCRDYSSYIRKISLAEESKWEKNRDLTVYSGVLIATAIFFILV